MTGCGYGTSAASGATGHQPGHRLNPPQPEIWLSISYASVPLLWTTERCLEMEVIQVEVNT